MAITYGYFNSINGDRVYSADQMSEYFDGLVSNGVYESVGGALQVMASTGMSVNVQTGRAIINSKWLKNDAVLPLEISAAHAVLNRYTAIVLRLDLVNRLMTITTKDGTPASSPTKPALQNDASAVELCLAYVYVGAAVTSITQANITDMRGSSSCPWVTGIVDQVNTSTLFAQYQTAYQEFYAQMQEWMATQQSSFDNWFSDLTKDLQVNTYIQEFDKTVSLTAASSKIIPLDMSGYTYADSDIFFVFINGLAAVENTDYLIDTRKTPVEMHINLVGSTNVTDTVEIKVLKSKIGDPAGAGGSSVNQKDIPVGASSTSTITGSGEVN